MSVCVCTCVRACVRPCMQCAPYYYDSNFFPFSPSPLLPPSPLSPLLSQSYTMRNGVLGVIGEVISQVLNSSQIDQQTKATRDKLLDRLEQHLHDVNAFVRSKCLQIWLQLCNTKVRARVSETHTCMFVFVFCVSSGHSTASSQGSSASGVRSDAG